MHFCPSINWVLISSFLSPETLTKISLSSVSCVSSSSLLIVLFAIVSFASSNFAVSSSTFAVSSIFSFFSALCFTIFWSTIFSASGNSSPNVCTNSSAILCATLPITPLSVITCATTSSVNFSSGFSSITSAKFSLTLINTSLWSSSGTCSNNKLLKITCFSAFVCLLSHPKILFTNSLCGSFASFE